MSKCTVQIIEVLEQITKVIGTKLKLYMVVKETSFNIQHFISYDTILDQFFSIFHDVF